MKTKVRVSIRLKLWKDGKLVVDTRKRIKARILSFAQVHLWDRAYLKVTYDRKNGYYNDGYYSTYEDLKAVLAAFTEKSLLDDFGVKDGE